MEDLKISETGKMTDIKGNKVKFNITKHVEIEETNHRLSDYPRKKISLQEITFPDGRQTTRICYYLCIKDGWKFIRSAPFIRSSDFITLIEKTKKKDN